MAAMSAAVTDPSGPLHWWSAHDLAAAIRTRRLSAVEVMQAHLDRIAAVNGVVNAIVSPLPAEQALDAAREADRQVARGAPLGPLHGLPTAVKDLMDVRGLPTTHGSAAHADAPPATGDSLIVERLRSAGAIVIGKTNTPEQGLGTLTFNPVFGITRNPWDLDRHAGGSSGGAGAALAAGMLPIADGSDSGGSIRYPSALCNTVGLRPSPGRVPSGRPGDVWNPHGVLGPMARSSRDAGLMLSAIAGRDDRSPIALDDDPAAFADPRPSDLRGLRIAWSHDGGGLPIDPEVRRVHAAARQALVDLGCAVVDVEPDFTGAEEAWEIIEMFGFYGFGGDALAGDTTKLRPDYLRNLRQGEALTAAELAHGLALRTDVYRRTVRLLEDFDLLALPATPVPAPPAEVEWVGEVDGTTFDRYFRWQMLANRITVTAHPALVTPAGFTAAGLPVGLQLVGRHRGDLALLRHGAAIEDATGWTARRPTGIPE